MMRLLFEGRREVVMETFSWFTTLDWAMVAAIAAIAALVASIVVPVWLHFRSRRNVMLGLSFGHESSGGVLKEERVDAYVGEAIDLRFRVFNLGASRSLRGRITISLGPMLTIDASKNWRPDKPNSLMPEGATAVYCKLARLGRNEDAKLPILSVTPNGLPTERGAPSSSYILCWEAWLGRWLWLPGNSDMLGLTVQSQGLRAGSQDS